MPMSKNYTTLRWGFSGCIMMLINLCFLSTLSAQSLACNGGVNVSVDVNCQAIIDASHVLKGEGSINPIHYQVIIKNRNGTVPMEIQSSSSASGPFVQGNAGTYIRFSKEGSYHVTVKRLSDGVECWGDILIEDKLPPFTVTCPCPENATVIGERCIFSCGSVYSVLNDTILTGIAGVNPEFRDNCGNIAEVEFIDDLARDTACGTWTITRRWRTLVSDGHGRKDYRDLQCTQKFYFEAADITTVHPPKKIVIVPCGTDIDPMSLRNHLSDTTIYNNPHPDSALVCAYPFIADTISSSHVVIQAIGAGLNTGTPDDLCRTIASYTDSPVFPVCEPYSYKIVRTWHILNWCTNVSLPVFHQTIKVVDTIGPGLIVKDTIQGVGIDPWTCAGNVIVPAPDSLWDNCAPANLITWRAYVNRGGSQVVANQANNYRLTGLPPGSYELFYDASDPCGNSTKKKSRIIIKDDVKPVAISRFEITVTFSKFNDSCTAKIFAHSIDSGSFDACDDKDLKLEIKRKNSAEPYADHVKFNQADISQVNEAGVPFGIVDVELKVTDKSGNFNIAWTRVRLEDKNLDVLTTCGDTLINLSCEANLDSAIVQFRPKANLKGCSQTALEVRDSVLSSTIMANCNLGRATVAYYLAGSLRPFCTKTFVFSGNQNFAINWPPAKIQRTCNQSDYGSVTFSNVGCRNLVVNDNDIQSFSVSPSEPFCLKLVRKITVIDWCQYVPNAGDSIGIYRFTQTIEIVDDSKPVISCENVSIVADKDCSLSALELVATAVDSGACSNELMTWTAALDTNNNGVYDLTLNVVGQQGQARATINTTLRAGKYKVRWRATNSCHKTGESICEVTIVDNTPPQLVCITALSTAVMNTDGTVAIWASDFELKDQKSVDNCGGPVKYSFSGDSPDINSLTITCQDIANGVSQVFTLQVYAWDESGNRDFCTVQLRVDDNVNICPNINSVSASVAGAVFSPDGEFIESATVMIAPLNNGDMIENITDQSGSYAFNNNEMGRNYEVKALKNDDPLNGVSTLDVILIQRHILGLSLLDSPYKVIAADVNGDKRITAGDLVALKRVLLGVEKQMPVGMSWRFVRADQQFADVLQPWPLIENRMIQNLQTSRLHEDFVAVKIGDVNGNAIANSGIARPRSSYNLVIHTLDKTIKRGELVELVIEPSDNMVYLGGQLSLTLSSGIWTDVSSSTMELTSGDYHIDGSEMHISWTNAKGVAHPQITLRLISDVDGMLRDILQLGDSMTAEYYSAEDFTVMNLSLQFIREQVLSGLELFQNKPNPFSDNTVIGFTIEEKDQVELSVFDLTGRQVYQIRGIFNSGYNEVLLDADKLNNTGVLYYQINYRDQIATKKMLFMNR